MEVLKVELEISSLGTSANASLHETKEDNQLS